jgi:trimeric autotransporter adhesin
MKPYLTQCYILRALVALAASIPLVPLTAQTTYTWDGNGTANNGGNWSDAVNWSSDHVPVTGGDVALLEDVTTGMRTIVYDSGASGFASTVQFNQTTAGATNLLSIQKDFSISNAVTVAATAGTAQVTLDVSGGSNVKLTAAGGLALGTNGVLVLGSDSAGKSGNLTGDLSISGGTLQAQATTYSSSVTNLVTGNLTMSSGAIVIDNTGAGIQGDRRITITGNANITGGTISSTRNGISGMLTLSGTTLIFNPTSFDSDLILTLDRSGDQNFTTNQTLAGALLLRGTGIKTVTRAGGSTINAISFIDGNSGTSIGTALKLGSDLTLASGAAQPFATNFGQQGTSIQLGIDTNGFTLDLSAGASGGIFTPANSTQSGVTTTTWTVSNSGAATGGIKATGFNFSSSGSVVNVGSGAILRATGGNNSFSNLGSAGTIASSSRFIYSGDASSANPATLTSGRTIGSLIVQRGALKIITADFSAAGGITVNSGALLDFSAQTVAATSLTLEVSGATFGQIKTGATTYDFNELTFNITATPVMGVLDLFDLGAGGSGSGPASVALSGLYGSVGLTEVAGVWTGDAGGFHFSFVEASGDLTVSAIPEPSVFAALAGLVSLGLAAAVRRRSRL